jgi:hypothetical protein
MATAKKTDDQGAVERSPAVAGAEQVQEVFDEAQAKGFYGQNTDPTPDEVYALPNPGRGKGGEAAPEIGGHTRAVVHAREHGLEFKDPTATKAKE